MSEEKKTCPGHERCPFCQKTGNFHVRCCYDSMKHGTWDTVELIWYHDDECQGIP